MVFEELPGGALLITVIQAGGGGEGLRHGVQEPQPAMGAEASKMALGSTGWLDARSCVWKCVKPPLCVLIP